MKRMATVLLAVVLCTFVVTAAQVQVSNAGKPKNFLPTPTPPLPAAAQADAAAPPTEGVYYVSPGGSDPSGNGSLESPWRTASYALDHGPSSGGFTVVLMDGDYPDQVTTRRSFAEPVQVRAMHDYQAVLVNSGETPISLNGSSDAHKSFNITFSGLEIKGLGSGSQGYALVYLWKADDVTLDNCIIHDSYNNDLMRVLHSARITIKNTMFYNPEAGEEAIDINGGSQDVVVADSIFFNDYAASGRSESPARPLILIKTSGLDSDGITRRITLERNIFLQKDTSTVWPSMVCLGADNKPYYEAEEVTIQNNLFAASDGRAIGRAVRVAGSRNVLIRANTLRSAAGSFQAMSRVEKMSSGPPSANVEFANNVFLDETGATERLIQGGPDDMESGVLHNNVYWFSGGPPPVRVDDFLNYTDDDRAVVADPLLPEASDRIPMPVWQGRVFAGGYGSIPGAFAAYVQRYAVPTAGSPLVDAANGNMPPNDITGSPRDGSPDVGAYEVESGSQLPTPTPTSMPTNTPLPPTATPTDTPLPPTATPTDTPVPPTATPTDTPVPPTPTPTDTPVPPTATPTDTPVPPTPTPTDTPVPPTDTPVPPTAAPTSTPLPPPATPTLVPPPLPAPPTDGVYYISPGGSDSSGNGSLENPWQTVDHALESGPMEGGFTVVLLDGEYQDPIKTDRSFAYPVLVRAMNDYQAVLVNTGKTPIKLTGSRRAHRSFNLTFYGLQIKGQGPRPQGYSLVYLWKADVVAFDNCVIHDSYRNDLMRVLHSARITVRNSIFYNPDPGEEALEIDGGSQDVVVEGSLFFNDYAASGRSGSSSRPFVLIKTSSLDSDGITRRITLQRNIFLQRVSDSAWPGQIHVGGDSKKDYMAQEVTVQNNLFVAADGQNIGVPIRVSAARDVVIRANTMRNGPGSFQAMGDIQSQKSGPICTNIQYANNVFLDADPDRFIRGDSGSVDNSALENNVYWRTPPVTAGDYLNYTDDSSRIEADPLLPPDGNRIPMPVLQGYGFAGGHVSIPGVFAAFVQRYAIPAGGSPMVDAASANMPLDDITGAARDGAPDVGAYEVNGVVKAPTPTPVPPEPPTSTPTDIPLPPVVTPTDMPVPPTAMPTDIPLPPTATPTDIPPPPLSTPTSIPVPPTVTPTDIPLPPTVTPTDIAVPPTATPTDIAVPPTTTPTDTPVPPTATPTDTPVPPTATATDTPVPPPTNTPVPPPTNTPVPPTATPTPVPPPPQDGVYYVSPGGSDSSGNGSQANPWKTAAYALDHGPSGGGFTVILMDGEYTDPIETDRSFAQPVLVRALNDYRAVLVNAGSTPIRLGGSNGAHRSYNITFSGLEIKGRNSGAQGYALVLFSKAADVVIDNCIIHDSYNNDLMRILHSVRITVRNSLFYNPEGPEEHIDVNGGSQDVVLQGNIFFNAYPGSTSRPLVLIKTSNLGEDGITRRITVERNIFLARDSGTDWQAQLNVGGDSKTYYTAEDVTVQNNLFVASDGQNVGLPIRVSGARNVMIRANTMRSGPGSFQAMGDIERQSSGPICTNIQYANNVFLDTDPNRFIRGDGGDVENSSLDNNVYWHTPPVTSGDYFNYTNDGSRIEADPLLPAAGEWIPMPVWQGHDFDGGYGSIRDAFMSYVHRYAVPAGGSPLVDAANGNMPPNDITGSPRGGAPDVGAYEVR